LKSLSRVQEKKSVTPDVYPSKVTASAQEREAVVTASVDVLEKGVTTPPLAEVKPIEESKRKRPRKDPVATEDVTFTPLPKRMASLNAQVNVYHFRRC